MVFKLKTLRIRGLFSPFLNFFLFALLFSGFFNAPLSAVEEPIFAPPDPKLDLNKAYSSAGILEDSIDFTPLGIGVLIDSEGTFITPYHLIKNHANLVLRMKGNERFNVEWVYGAISPFNLICLGINNPGKKKFNYFEIKPEKIFKERKSFTTLVIDDLPKDPYFRKDTLETITLEKFSYGFPVKKPLPYIYEKIFTPRNIGRGPNSSDGSPILGEMGQLYGILSNKGGETSEVENKFWSVPVFYIHHWLKTRNKWVPERYHLGTHSGVKPNAEKGADPTLPNYTPDQVIQGSEGFEKPGSGEVNEDKKSPLGLESLNTANPTNPSTTP